MSCLTHAWTLHEAELRGWARHKLGNTNDAEDLFLKALRQGEQFCSVQNARAWLFEVARNTLADRLRVARIPWSYRTIWQAPWTRRQQWTT